jgi:AcrR family transcriptional regulator
VTTSDASAPGTRATAPDGRRLTHADRRDALLDAAAGLVVSTDVDEISMESVADAAGVSRALVYKHFPNRQELLSAVYEREAALLHARISAGVAAAENLTSMIRALVHGALEAQASRGTTIAALAAGGGRTTEHQALQRRRDGRTLRYFARRAVTELGLNEAEATAACAISLGAIQSVLARWRLRPTKANAALLEHIYVTTTMAGLRALAQHPRP